MRNFSIFLTLATLIFSIFSGCGKMTVDTAVLPKAPDTPQFQLKLNDNSINGSLDIQEGFGLLIVLMLSEPAKDQLTFDITLIHPTYLISEHFSQLTDALIIPKGASSGTITLTTLDNSYYYANNAWTMRVKHHDSNIEASEIINIIDNDPIQNTPPLPHGTQCQGGASFAVNSGAQLNGEYLFEVTPDKVNCQYQFTVKGAGGGSAYNTSLGGNGGLNTFTFTPGKTGLLRIVVGGGGALSIGNYGGTGGGATSVMFDPDLVSDATDAFMLSIAGGGGGSGSLEPNEHGAAGNGDGAGAGGTGDGGGAPGDGTGGTSIDSRGGNCASLCQGGRGGDSYRSGVTITGGFGKGPGSGGQQYYGGAGGGGFGGGGAARWDARGGGGAGKVFSVSLPSVLVNTTVPSTSLGGGGLGGSATLNTNGEDGQVLIQIN